MNRWGIIIFLLCASTIFFSLYNRAYAQSAADIQSQIDANNRQLEVLKAEIAIFEQQLDALEVKKDTLQSTINALTLSQKQLATQIQITQNKIASANLQIRQLTLSIGDKEASMAADRDAISKALRIVADGERTPLIAALIATKTLGEAWRVADAMSQFNRSLSDNIVDLQKIRTALATNRDAVAVAKASLVALQNDLAIQKKSVEVSRAAQQKLLAETRNQEGAYQKLVAQKRAQQAEFEAQLFTYEQKLRETLDLSGVPSAHAGILSRPLAMLRVTQYFGRTIYAKRLYVSGTHGGVDFKASIGTPVMAALSGTVVDTEGAKVRNGCQYGKWVLIKHANGLTTIYGHLSYVYVQSGATVTTGQVIGLSGNTGYAEGPHLHFGVYASNGVRIVDAGALGSVRCAGIKTVAASPAAYLNPLVYL